MSIVMSTATTLNRWIKYFEIAYVKMRYLPGMILYEVPIFRLYGAGRVDTIRIISPPIELRSPSGPPPNKHPLDNLGSLSYDFLLVVCRGTKGERKLASTSWFYL